MGGAILTCLCASERGGVAKERTALAGLIGVAQVADAAQVQQAQVIQWWKPLFQNVNRWRCTACMN